MMLSLGALIDDLFGSFVKRRLGMKPDTRMLISDKIDFVLMALLFGFPIKPVFLTAALIIIFLTGPIHFLINFIAYLVRLKDNPW
jgi:CDP-2,3-bis-(O-geranylgeranyl)-sn-glycerol synthase